MTDQFIVSIDVGTTSMAVCIGEVREDGGMKIVGAGRAPSDGIRKGVVVDIEEAAAAVREAAGEAERMAGARIEGVCAGIASPHIRCFNSRGVIPVEPTGREVTRRDIDRVTATARDITLPADREILHAIPQDYMVDRQTGIADPAGMSAARLGAELHIVTGLRQPVEHFTKVIEKAGYELINVVFDPLAAAEAVLREAEREAGCLLVDIGGGVTSFALFHGGCARASGVIPAGGQNITGDLAIGLRVPTATAEALKLERGVALASMAPAEEEIELPPEAGSGMTVRTQIVAAIVEPRCEEIFDMVKEAVATDPHFASMGGGVVLTGGGSRLAGMEGVAGQVFDLPVRRGVPLGFGGLAELVEDERWSTAAGLLRYEAERVADDRRAAGGFERFTWMLSGIRKIAGLF
ncbi:MAG: cell division protein FtsA [Candidatus Krumholzibacteriota bacterium]|nr:cell division protein FtsA [Candidatus Krumholzibacteriota bacterium]